MKGPIPNLCKGSGRVLDKQAVINRLTGQVETFYTCPVCGAHLQPLRNAGSRRHSDSRKKGRTGDD